MKNYLFFIINLIFVQIYPSVSQTTYWVSNNPSDAQLVDYNNLQTAINAVSPGDVLYVYPSEFSYGSVTIDKSVTIQGMGYQFNAIAQPALDIQTSNYQSTFNSLTVLNTLDVNISGLFFNHFQIINSDNISITTSYIAYGSIENSENIVVANCYIGNNYITHQPNHFVNFRFINTNNFILSNTIFHQVNGSGLHHNLLVGSDCGNAVIQNCIFSDDSHLNNCYNINNIYYGAGLSCTNCTVTNNVFTGGYSNNPPGNLYNIQDPIFVGLPTQGSYSFDSRYQLLPNTPARNYGVNGVDCGVFDGDFPYRYSGITRLPIVSELVVPTAVYSGDGEMEITVRVKIID